MTDTDDREEVEVLPKDKEEKEGLSTNLTRAADILPQNLYLIPLTDRPFFPPQTLPVILNESPWLETVEKVGETPQHVVGLILGDRDEEGPNDPEAFAPIGTAVRMHQPMRASEKIQFVAEGTQRYRIVRWLSRETPYLVEVEYLSDEGDPNSDEVRAYAMAIINTIKELVPLNPLYSEELKYFLNRFNPTDPGPLTDFAASLTTADRYELQGVLESVTLLRRMEKVMVLLKKELEVAKLQTEIREQVEEKMSRQQREFFLKEQLKTIQQELGIAKDDKTADLERFRDRLEGLDVPKDARKRIDEELDKLSILETGSPEYGVTRNYLDALTALPWGKFTEDKLDLDRAREILDRDHDGLEDVKARIIEFLAVGALKKEIAGSILLLVGPPGVGKTSIGRSVADALGREFYRFSLGGMRDEAEIKGHRRTYIGAMPGKFIQAIKEVGSANPVIMLDEIDKVGASYRGDPASALLEVLDPEQNSDFLDHYLDVRFDLSKVLFICTANQLDTIPQALLDRMETLRLSGYITAEKMAIARHHLWPRQLERAGLKRGQVKLTTGALRQVIEGYAREAGVRGLEKQLGRIVRHAVVAIVKGKKQTVQVSNRDVEAYLGKAIFHREVRIGGVGVITGLAWTPMGGATLSIEANQTHSRNRGFKLTGQLGDVMRESAEIAYSYIAAHLKEFRGAEDFFEQTMVHLHVPEGATPKDGPSAGVTMASALLSLARNRQVGRNLAMTGELTLTGHVLPVGGIREKVIAARRSRIFELILPEANRGDFEELPEHIRAGMTVHFASRYRDVYKHLFED